MKDTIHNILTCAYYIFVYFIGYLWMLVFIRIPFTIIAFLLFGLSLRQIDDILKTMINTTALLHRQNHEGR